MNSVCTFGLISGSTPCSGWDTSADDFLFQANTEVAEVSPVCGIGDAKRRRVSSTRDTDKTEADLPQETPSTGSEQQPDIKDEAPVPGNTGR